jgi:acetate kinase
LLNRESGIAGVSSHGGDLRDVHSANDTSSRLAIDMFISSVAKAIEGMATVLSGLDMVVFSGGIGEHDEQIRSAILERISWAGQPRSMVVPAEEEDMITRHTFRVAIS